MNFETGTAAATVTVAGVAAALVVAVVKVVVVVIVVFVTVAGVAAELVAEAEGVAVAEESNLISYTARGQRRTCITLYGVIVERNANPIIVR